MPSSSRLFGFLFTVLGATLCALTACLAVKNLAGHHLSPVLAWIVGVSSATVPAYYLNKTLTDAYRRHCTDDGQASEIGSFFGTMAVVGFSILFALWMGCAGLRGTWAVRDALQAIGPSPFYQGPLFHEPLVLEAPAVEPCPEVVPCRTETRASRYEAPSYRPATMPWQGNDGSLPAESRPSSGLAGSDVNGSGIKCYGGGSVTIIN